MNIMRSGGYGMRYEVIRRFVGRDGDEVMRLNAYVAIDEERAISDPNYKNTLNFILTLRDLGFKAVEKPIRWYTDDSGRTYGKANLDMEMGLDIVSQSDRLDLIYLFTGDGDFCSVVTMAQNKGCRVELVAFANVSGRLRREVDLFVPGYLIPGLLPTSPPYAGAPPWGENGSRVRGVCAWRNRLIPRCSSWKRTCRRGSTRKISPAGTISLSSPSRKATKASSPRILS
jgi:hypothetical protein